MTTSTSADAGADRSAEKTTNQFGTFGGVFTPSLLTILGVIMFMSTGTVVGRAGILYAIVILLISKTITVLTGLSISAISTNTNVKGGGAYFLISRSLGPEFGGAIGLTLFFAQAVSVPFYILGFTKAFVRSFKHFRDWSLFGATPFAEFFQGIFVHLPQSLESSAMWIGMGTATALFVINLIGASWAIKAQYFILAALVLSIITFLGGGILQFDVAQFNTGLQPNYGVDIDSFWAAFAIFFPAVTGIMAGVNMSGDLKNPAKSIPRGTLYAIAVGGVIYLAQMIIIGGANARTTLAEAPYESLMENALGGAWAFVVVGVFAATLSSALGSMMGAPRILQALSRDAIFRSLHIFAKGTLRGDEPQRALVLTYAITVGVIWLAGNQTEGDAFNMVAEVLSMFFLYAYGMTNLAAFTESFSGNPSFRPRFRYFNWVTALLGTIGCIGVTFLINPLASLIAVATIIAVFIYVRRRVLSTSFGDARRGFFFSLVRDNLFRLAKLEPHPKNWRPSTLVLSGNPHTRLALSNLAIWMASGRGLVTLAEILVGDFHEEAESRQTAQERLDDYIKERNIQAFGEVLIADNFDHGMTALVQAHSVGPLKPNMVIMGWSGARERAKNTVKHMLLAQELGISQVLVQDRGLPEPGSKNRIDIWWRGDENGSLMVILAYLLTLNWEWNRTTVRMLRLVSSEEQKQQAHDEINELVEAARIDAEIQVVVGDNFLQVIHETSGDASVVFLGFNVPPLEDAEAFYDRFHTITKDLPTTLLVRSSGEADLLA